MTKRGYKQTEEHVRKRIKHGVRHANWVGSDVSVKGGRTRALRLYPQGPCVDCGSEKGERHHVNGDTSDNSPENVKFPCRSCHMKCDGRLQRLSELGKRIDKRGEKNGNCKLTDDQVREIRTLHESGTSVSEIMEKFSISRTHTHRIISGKGRN